MRTYYLRQLRIHNIARAIAIASWPDLFMASLAADNTGSQEQDQEVSQSFMMNDSAGGFYFVILHTDYLCL